jgi:hypothetical protein
MISSLFSNLLPVVAPPLRPGEGIEMKSYAEVVQETCDLTDLETTIFEIWHETGCNPNQIAAGSVIPLAVIQDAFDRFEQLQLVVRKPCAAPEPVR